MIIINIMLTMGDIFVQLNYSNHRNISSFVFSSITLLRSHSVPQHNPTNRTQFPCSAEMSSLHCLFIVSSEILIDCERPFSFSKLLKNLLIYGHVLRGPSCPKRKRAVPGNGELPSTMNGHF